MRSSKLVEELRMWLYICRLSPERSFFKRSRLLCCFRRVLRVDISGCCGRYCYCCCGWACCWFMSLTISYIINWFDLSSVLYWLAPEWVDFSLLLSALLKTEGCVPQVVLPLKPDWPERMLWTWLIKLLIFLSFFSSSFFGAYLFIFCHTPWRELMRTFRTSWACSFSSTFSFCFCAWSYGLTNWLFFKWAK